jgi:hypothetical protein
VPKPGVRSSHVRPDRANSPCVPRLRGAKSSCEEFVTLGQKAAADIGKWARAPKMRARLGSA